MEAILGWLSENSSWIFSGMGVGIITGLLALVKQKRKEKYEIGLHIKNINISDGKSFEKNIKISANSDIKAIITGVIDAEEKNSDKK